MIIKAIVKRAITSMSKSVIRDFFPMHLTNCNHHARVSGKGVMYRSHITQFSHLMRRDCSVVTFSLLADSVH